MIVYALVGKSGTGKSYQANELCQQYDIDGIIDDGLYIRSGIIVAGISAKRQNTYIKAVKTALFNDENHKIEVSLAIKKSKLSSILVIGTSEKMIGIICERLQVGQPKTIFYIEDIVSVEQIDLARTHRMELGQHIIPAPTMEVKKTFSGYFVHPIRTVKSLMGSGVSASKWMGKETSVVRPTYSYMGNYSLADKSIMDIMNIAMQERDNTILLDTYLDKFQEGISIEIGVSVAIGENIFDVTEGMQQMLAEKIEELTALNVLMINVIVRKLH